MNPTLRSQAHWLVAQKTNTRKTNQTAHLPKRMVKHCNKLKDKMTKDKNHQ